MNGKEGLQVVVFHAGESDYCADIRDVREIIRLDTVTTLPGSGEDVEGIINVRGEIVPLVSLRVLAGLPRQGATKETRVLIVDQKPAFGLIVDRVGEVKNLPGDACIPMPTVIKSRVNNDLFTGIGKLPDQILVVIDLKKVMAKEEAEVEIPGAAESPSPAPAVVAAPPAAESPPPAPAPVAAPPAPAAPAQPAPSADCLAEAEEALVCSPAEAVAAGDTMVVAAPAPAAPARSDAPIEINVKEQLMSDFHLDALREVGNIGTSHAATSLSTLVGSPINMTVPHIKLIQISNVSGILNESMVVGLLLELKNGEDTSGFLYNLFPISSALRIVDKLLGLEQGTTKELDEMGQSAITEVGNIISSSFCDAIADFLGITLLPTPPNFVCDMADSILQNTLIEISMMADDAIIFRTDLADDSRIFEGYVLMFPNPDTLEKILKIIDSKLGC